LILECRVRGQPTPKITWYKDSEEIITGEKYRQWNQYDGRCNLIINNPTNADNGVYICKAQNSANMEQVQHTVEFTNKDQSILERTHGFFHRDPNKPHFTSPLVDQQVPAGGTFALQVEIHGQVDIQWYKGKDQITPATSPKIQTYSDQGVYTLAVNNAQQTEAGAYMCRAINAFGKADSTGHIDVVNPVKAGKGGGRPALFVSRPDPILVIKSEDNISISFRVQGEPKPKCNLDFFN